MMPARDGGKPAQDDRTGRTRQTPVARRDRGSSLRAMLFRQWFDPVSSTYTDLLADVATGQALLIDTVFEPFEGDRAPLHELG